METKKVLDLFGDKVTHQARVNLELKKKNNSKDLWKSIAYHVQVSKTTVGSFEFDIVMEDYGEWVDKGRKPGKGVPPEALYKWIKTKPVRLRDLKTGQFVKSTESKIKSLAFLINRKIKEEGIAATNFLSDPFNKYFPKLPDDLIEAFSLDVDDLLKFGLDKLNKDYK